MKSNEVAILKISTAGYPMTAKRLGSQNAMPIPSVTSDKGYEGGSVLALSNKDNQNCVVIAFGGFVTP